MGKGNDFFDIGDKNNTSTIDKTEDDFFDVGESDSGFAQSPLDNPLVVGDITEFQDRRDNAFLPTGGFEAIRKEAAINQSTGEQLANSAIRFLPAVGLGIIENAGYLLEIPNALGDTKDFINPITEFATKNREKLEGAFPILRENPNQTFDLTDNAFWIQHGAGLFESIGEFLVTGAGVGKALGAGAKGLNQLLNLGHKGQVVTQGLAQGLTAASLAYVEGAMSGARIYDETYRDALSRDLTPDQANVIASKAASTTVLYNTVLNTILNITSVAPMFARNLSKTAKLKNAIREKEGTVAYRARLKEIADDPLNGFRPNTKEVLLREALQEGLEEQVNLASEVEGRLSGGLITEEEAGGKDMMQRFLKSSLTEEGALNFMLGAIGGVGQTGGIHLANSKKNKKQLEDLEKQRINNVENILNNCVYFTVASEYYGNTRVENAIINSL